MQAPALAELEAQTGEKLTPLNVAAAPVMKEKNKKPLGIMAAAAADTPPSNIGIDARASNEPENSQTKGKIKASSEEGGKGINLNLLRTALSVIATQPNVGESPLAATARGALGGLQAQMQDKIKKDKIARTTYLRGSTTSDTLLNDAAKGILSAAQLVSPGGKNLITQLKAEARAAGIQAAESGVIPITGVQRDNYTIAYFQRRLRESINNPDVLKEINRGDAAMVGGGINPDAIRKETSLVADEAMDTVLGTGIQNLAKQE